MTDYLKLARGAGRDFMAAKSAMNTVGLGQEQPQPPLPHVEIQGAGDRPKGQIAAIPPMNEFEMATILNSLPPGFREKFASILK